MDNLCLAKPNREEFPESQILYSAIIWTKLESIKTKNDQKQFAMKN